MEKPDAEGKVRRRRPADKSQPKAVVSAELNKNEYLATAEDKGSRNTTLDSNADALKESYWLTRILLLRFMGFMYFVAFAVALHQNEALIGTRGLLPYNSFLKKLLREARGSKFEVLSQCPTLMLFVPDQYGDSALNLIAAVGLLISAAVMLTGAANAICMVVLWLLYHSIVNVGQRWYSFGWESQMLESGFLAIFLCPLIRWEKLPEKTWPSSIVMFLFRWLLFRIMLGAGLIKLRGDHCWYDLTCTAYHYETQPVPNPLSYYMHQAPLGWHKFEVLSNHFAEIIAPFMLLVPWPRMIRAVGGVIQLQFQIAIIVSGNFAFLNWITMLPCFACFDDYTLSMFHRRKTVEKVAQLNAMRAAGWGRQRGATIGQNMRVIVNISLLALISYLSLPVMINLVSRNQIMNTSFEPLRLVNTYGAFGTITKQRTELVLEGTSNTNVTAADVKWLEYEFKCKPGAVTRRPCLISPYHYRLDWLMWFAAMQPAEYSPWLFSLVGHLLENDLLATSLLANNPFYSNLTAAPPPSPAWIRVRHYSYKWTSKDSPEAKQGNWWKRQLIREFLPPMSRDQLRPFLAQLKREPMYG